MVLSRHLSGRIEKKLSQHSLAEIGICDLLTKQECCDLNVTFPKKIANSLDVDSAHDFHCPGKYIQIKLDTYRDPSVFILPTGILQGITGMEH
jgi:hypothetical protein